MTNAAQLMIGLSGDLMPDANDRRHLSHPAIGGVILFARNFSDAAQLRQLTAEVRRAAGRKIVIAADQEGGRVQRFCGGDFSRLPAAATLQNTESAHDAGTVMAAELLAAGIDLSFAPVLDLAHKRSRIIGARAFAADGEEAASAALAFAAGMRAAGMASCGKHFPGHGYARADSHKTLPTDERDYATIAATDLIPFARWAAQKMPALMTAHIVYPQCDSAAATFSPFWLKKVLRKQLKFSGMIISDDLTMEGADIGNIKARMQSATAAGCEGLLICNPQAVPEALSASPKRAANNPWQQLAARTDGRICIGDAAYRESRARLLE